MRLRGLPFRLILLAALSACRAAICPTGTITDCDGVCQPKSTLGDGACDAGVADGPNFACVEQAWDEGDCPEPGPPEPEPVDTSRPGACPEGEIHACDGACVPASRLGNGFCDLGEPQPWGVVDLNCFRLDFDAGDCGAEAVIEFDTTDTDGCPKPGMVSDCDGNCAPIRRVDNGFCDDGEPQPWGDFNFDCRRWEWDEGDCEVPDSADTDSDPPCPAGQVLDCANACAPLARLGGVCDDGPGPGWGSYDFNCPDFDWDQGSCDVPDSADTDSDPPCPAGQVLDCANACAPLARLGGVCDDGPGPGWGSYDFNCPDFDWDQGACDVPDSADTDSDPPCPAGQVLDCGNACYAATRVGNGFCDDGRVQPWGASDFACPAFGWDGGDCDAPESLPDPDTDAADTEPADTDTTDTELTDTDTTDTEPADTDTPPALPDTGLPASP